MTTTTDRPARNGVDTPALFATLDAVKQAPEAAKFQFRTRNEWISGTQSRGTIDGFYGVGEERTHERKRDGDRRGQQCEHGGPRDRRHDVGIRG